LPRIPADMLKSTIFLYKSEEDAVAGKDGGGTGFIFGVRLKADTEQFALYAVTNWHVACRGSSVIRVNRKGGGVDVIDFGPEDWIFSAASHDIAMVPFPLDAARHDVKFFGTEMFATDAQIAKHQIGPGEDVFMVGRFVDAGGIQSNQPAVRFGNISMMPAPMKQENGATVPSYAIDMHSRSGFSGSPVFVYRKPGQDLGHGNMDLGDQFLFLLGIHWGQFPEMWEIKDKPRKAAEDAGEVSLDADAKYVSGLSGMTCVAPASAIVDLLNHPKLIAQREALERSFAARIAIKNVDFSVPKGEQGLKLSGSPFGSFPQALGSLPGKK
jgi:hypothetical protein